MSEYFPKQSNHKQINKDGIKINVDVMLKNLLIKEYVIKDLFGTLETVSVDVINLVMLVNI